MRLDWDVLVCYIDARKNMDKPAGSRQKDNDSIYKTCKRIMDEDCPCDDCVQASTCKHECSLFGRFVNSKGKHWKEIDKWKNEPVEVKCFGWRSDLDG